MTFHFKLFDDFCCADKVFGPDSLTANVYEEGVKNVALSALMGINGKALSFCPYSVSSCFVFSFNFPLFAATVFAYGQTSSGKTYTMRGITEKAVNDIYHHIINVSFLRAYL